MDLSNVHLKDLCFLFPVTDTRSRSNISSLRTKTLNWSPSTHHREEKAMLEKAEETTPQKGGGKKRKHPGGDDGKGEERMKRGGEEGERSHGDRGRKRLDALSVGYFRRVGERLGEGFEDKEERGENKCSDDLSHWKVGKVQKKNTWHYSSTPPYHEVQITWLCLHHIDTSDSPYHQKLSNLFPV